MRTGKPEGWDEALAAGNPYSPLILGPVGVLASGSSIQYPIQPANILSASMSVKLFDQPSIGNAACGIFKLSAIPNSSVSRVPFLYTMVRLALLNSTTSGALQWNRFYPDVIKKSRNGSGVWEFTCYDRMIYAEADYEDQEGTYPMPAKDVVAYIADQLGVSVDERGEIGDFDVDSPTGVYTMREVLRFIAAGSGGNFIINSSNKLQLVPFGSPAETEEQACSELDYADALTITGVRLFPDSETQYFSGDETGFVIEGECAYATQEICDAVAAKLIGKVYRAFEAKEVLLDPWAELGDSIRLGGIDFTIASINYTYSAAMAATIGAPWLEEVEHLIPCQSRDRQTRMNARSFSEIRKSVDEVAIEVDGKKGKDAVNALISVGLNGITLSAEEGENKCTITLTGEGLDAKQVVAEFSKIIADEVSASNIIAGTLQAGEVNTSGSFQVGYMDDDGEFAPTGYVGDGYGTDASGTPTNGAVLASIDGNCYVIVTNGGVRLQAGSNRVVVTPQNISITSDVGDVLVNGKAVGQAVFG